MSSVRFANALAGGVPVGGALPPVGEVLCAVGPSPPQPLNIPASARAQASLVADDRFMPTRALEGKVIA
jgi:hypothetical protein